MSVTLPDDLWAKIYGFLRDTVWKVNDVYYSVLSINRASLFRAGMTFPLNSFDFRWGMSAGWIKEQPPIDWTDFTYEQYERHKQFNWSNYFNPWNIMRTSTWDPEKQRRREEANKNLRKWVNRTPKHMRVK
jgi:hypothetical protein